MPMSSVSATDRSCSGFGRQSATKTAMSSSPIRIPGCRSNTSRASASLFFEQTARMTPRSLSASTDSWNAWNASPSGVSPSRSPRTPSSPTIPPQSVLSRSSTRHFLPSPSRAAITAAVCRASSGSASSATACFARCQ